MKNKIFKRKSIILYVVLTLFLLFSVETCKVSADLFTDIDINKYTAILTIDSDGDMYVKETWDMNYPEGYNVRFRDIEYNKFPSDYPLPFSEDNVALFNKEEYSIEVHKAVYDYTTQVEVGYSFRGDLDERYEEISCPAGTDPLCESIFINFSDIGGLVGNIQIEYNYVIEDVVTEYSDISEINWVLFEYAESSVKEGSIDIFLPNNPNHVEDIEVFTALIRHSDVEVKSNENITIDFNDMKRNDQLGFRLLVPTNTFTSIEDNNIFIHEDMNRQAIVDFEEQLAIENGVSVILTYVLIGISMMAIFYYIYKIDKLNRTVFAKYKTMDSDQVINTIPTEHKPAVVGYLYRNRISSDEDISATLLDLISRGYLLVDDSKVFNDPDYSLDDLVIGEKQKIIKIKDPSYYASNTNSFSQNKTYTNIDDNFDMDLVLNRDKQLEDLEPYELHLIEWYINRIGDGDRVSTKEMVNIEDIEKSSTYIDEALKFNRLIEESCEDIPYYDDLSQEISKSNMGLIPLGIILLVSIISGVVLNSNVVIPMMICVVIGVTFAIYVNTRRRKTFFIQDFYEKWNRYKKNLETLNVLKTANISDVDFWDNNLIYATVFGIADEVLVQLRSVYVENASQVTTDTQYSSRYNNYYYYSFWHRHMRTYHRKVLTKSTRNVNPSSSRRGGSFGGGFSGGGSFGGGGGGGRSR